jgi:hypothetical protein
MTVGVVGEGVLRFGTEACGWGGVGAVNGGRGGSRGAKNPGGGIPGGRAGKLTVGGGGKGGANLGEVGTGTGAIENGVLDDRGGMVCGKRPASAAVSCTNPTEPGMFFEEFPPP